MGNDDNTPTNGITGGKVPARIWKHFMSNSLKHTPATPLVTTPLQRSYEPYPEDGRYYYGNEGQRQRPDQRRRQKSRSSGSFWDGIFGTTPSKKSKGSNNNNPEVEYTYPKSRKN